MSTKQQVLFALEKNRGNPVSGQQLAQELQISRNAVWKAVKALQLEGICIEAGTRTGYRLLESNDYLSVQGISKYLAAPAANFDIEVYKSVSSTNTLLKEEAAKGAPAGRVIVAETQTAGRGRFGRSFYSPVRAGIYMSLLLRPQLELQQSLFLTTATAVAVSKAIDQVTGKATVIKWVNDIYYKNKKVCGILTEAATDFESGNLEYAVIGIGVNVTAPEEAYPEQLQSVAAPVFDKDDYHPENRCRLAGEILNQLAIHLQDPRRREYLEAYRNKSFLVGQEIYILPREKEGSPLAAKVIGIDDNVGLVVQFPDGRRKTLTAGEVSIRKAEE